MFNNYYLSFNASNKYFQRVRKSIIYFKIGPIKAPIIDFVAITIKHTIKLE